jgi:hypothetical protein
MKRSLPALACLLFGIATVNAQTAKLMKDVDEYIKIIKTDKEAKNRADAIGGLAEVAEVRAALIKPAVPVLVAALKDSAVEVRKGAVGLLAGIEPYDKGWVPNLLGLLAEGEDRDARLAAIGILGGIEGGAKEALAPLQEIHTKEAAKPEGMRDNELLNAIAGSLDGIRDRLANGCAVTLRQDKQAKARAAAATELTKLGQEKIERIKPYIPNLLEALKDSDAAVRQAALAGLAVAKPESQDLVPALIDRLKNIREERGVRLAVVELLGALGPNAADAVPYLEVWQQRETKKDTDRDKEMLDKLVQALEAIKKQP